MEIILAFTVTLLAIILGFLSTRSAFSFKAIFKLVSPHRGNEGTNMSNSNDAKKETETDDHMDGKEGKLCPKEFAPHPLDSPAEILDSGELHTLSQADSSKKPLKVKEFIRMLRDSQQEDMTEDEKEEEKRIQREQLQKIFQLMQSSQNQYGINSFDDMEEQMKLYAVGE